VTPSSWDRLEFLLEQAGEVSAAHRAAFVERETRGDPDLRVELVTLLDASEGADEYVSRLRRELLGSDVEGVLRDAPTAGEAPDPWIGRTVAHYEILDRIGAGGMGVIYRARDVTLDRIVALKFIAPELRRDPEVERRFLHEARAASALDHPNICAIHEIAPADDGRLYIVMAAYQGETLRARLGQGPLSVQEALDIGEQIARALAAAHERGIVHRDVKPDNVFLTRDGVIKLLDFGLARTADSRMSGPGAVEGTVAYMSPEQAGGERADERSDVWSLGVILFEMLAGVRPFAAGDCGTALHLIRTREPDLKAARPDLPPAVANLVHRALAKRMARRFADGREVLRALQACRAATAPASAKWRSRARSIRASAPVLATLILATALALGIRGSRDPARTRVTVGSVSHVLWVDDDSVNNETVIRQLRDRGVRVTTSLTTTDALRRYDPTVHHLVVSDMGRYEGAKDEYVARAGFDLLARLQARHDGVRLIFCTSNRAVATHGTEALAAGAQHVINDCEEILGLIGVQSTGRGSSRSDKP
jgi:serine/threonine protein kinase